MSNMQLQAENSKLKTTAAVAVVGAAVATGFAVFPSWREWASDTFSTDSGTSTEEAATEESTP